jgi:hypothetical protein
MWISEDIIDFVDRTGGNQLAVQQAEQFDFPEAPDSIAKYLYELAAIAHAVGVLLETRIRTAPAPLKRSFMPQPPKRWLCRDPEEKTSSQFRRMHGRGARSRLPWARRCWCLRRRSPAFSVDGTQVREAFSMPNTHLKSRATLCTRK